MGWIGVDLDATLAFASSKYNELEIGDPIPLMLQRVKKWLKEGKEVRIVTARVSGHPSWASEMSVRRAIERWCEKHLGKVLPITCCKDYEMIELWDDRAVTVEYNTGKILTRGKGD